MKLRRLLKAAQTQLEMSDQVYRDNLEQVTGKRSSTQLTERQCKAALAHFKKLGYSPKSNPRDSQIKLIKYLWLQLGKANKLRSPELASMYEHVRTFTGDVSIYNASHEQLSSCIESLKSWCTREKVEINAQR